MSMSPRKIMRRPCYGEFTPISTAPAITVVRAAKEGTTKIAAEPVIATKL